MCYGWILGSPAEIQTEGQPCIPRADHDPGNLPGRKAVKRTFRKRTAEPPPVKRQATGGGLFHMGT